MVNVNNICVHEMAFVIFSAWDFSILYPSRSDSLHHNSNTESKRAFSRTT
jgi:hypothetical protein